MRIIIFILFFLVPMLLSAQTIRDTVTVVQDSEISSLAVLTDSTNLYTITSSGWRKFRLDTLVSYLNTKGLTGGTIGRAIQSLTCAGSETLDFNESQLDYWQIDLSNVTACTLSFANPLLTAVPTYNLHFVNAVTDTVYFSSLNDANQDPITSHIFEQGQIVPVYYDGVDYFTNYLNFSGAGIDTTTLLAQDSILIYSVSGSEVGRDTIRVTGGPSIPSNFTAEYQAILNYANTNGYSQPGSADQTIQNALIDSIKTAGIWDSLVCLYVMDNGSEEFRRINFADPNNFYLLKPGGTFTTTDTGLISDTNTSWLNTQIDATTDLSPASDTNFGFGFVMPSDTMGVSFAGYADTGAGLETRFQVFLEPGTKEVGARIFYSNLFPTDRPVYTAGDVYHGGTDGTNVEYYLNGVSQNSNTTSTPGSAQSGDIALFGINTQSGIVIDDFGYPIRIFYISTKLTDTEVTDLHNAITTYINAQ